MSFSKEQVIASFFIQIQFLLPLTIIINILYIRGSLNKFPDFFRMGTFIDSIHIKL